MVMEINFENVSADYRLGPIRTANVLDNINLHIKTGSFTAVVGRTGSGKSSLLKTMNGLIQPNRGKIHVGDITLTPEKDKKTLKKARKRVGMVFQFPESQIFAETVEKDICFGPMNFGIPFEEAKKIAHTVIRQVGLDPSYLQKSPFSLSGGEKRRWPLPGFWP